MVVAYFYGRLARIYDAEYLRRLPDEHDVINSKREWAEHICCYSLDQIDKGCSWMRQQKINHVDGWQFMDIGRCIGAIREANQVKAAHKPFTDNLALPDITGKEKRREAGKKTMQALREMMQ